MVSSWSTNAAAGAGQELTMKVFRKVADPATYKVVGHDGPRPLEASAVNLFGASVPVKPGDVLGLNSSRPAMTACAFPVIGENRLIRIGDLADGESGAFSPASPDRRTNISAVVEPSNVFTLGRVTRHVRKGTATLRARVPNSGKLVLSGNGVTRVARMVSPGAVNLQVSARGQKRRKLDETGTVNVRPKVTYTPTDGDPATQSRRLTLKKG